MRFYDVSLALIVVFALFSLTVAVALDREQYTKSFVERISSCEDYVDIVVSVCEED